MSRSCSSEGVVLSPCGGCVRHRGWSPRSAAAGTIALWGGIALAILGSQPFEARADDLAISPDGKVRCPDCDRLGREKCPQCKGKGLLPRDCPKCNTTGRRPCRVCNEGEDAHSPGHLSCPFCGGTGTVGDDGRTCSRCKGNQTVLCGTCLGKGSHPCRKQIFDEVCPTCRFVGKIVCTTCEGEMWLDRAVLLARKKAKRKPDETATATKRKKRRRSSREGDATEARAEVDLADMRVRFDDLTPIYEAHYDVFVDDLRPEISDLYDKVKALDRQLRSANGGGAMPLSAELTAWQKRAKKFRQRWSNLHDLFKKERQTYLNAKSVWQARDAAIKGLKGRRLEIREQEHRSRMVVATKVAERTAAPLVHMQPETLLVEVRDLRDLWTEFERRSKLAMTTIEKKAAEEAAENNEKKALEKAASAREKSSLAAERGGKRPPRRASKAEGGAAAQGGRRGQRRGPDTADSASTKRPSAATKSEKRKSRKNGQAGAMDNSELSEGGPLGTVFAALIGFATACSFFFLRGFRRQRLAS